MTILFCPFCEESFEGETLCPEHELELVPFDKLRSRLDEDVHSEREHEDTELDALHPGYMRGPVALGAFTTLVGFFLPFVEYQLGDELATASAYSFALQRATNLWTPLGVALAQLAVLGARRTPRSMRSARLTMPLLSAVGGASIVYTSQRVFEHVASAGGVGHNASASLLAGAWLMAAGLTFSGLAGLRLGLGAPGDQVDSGDHP